MASINEELRMSSGHEPQLSIVIPAFNEEGNLDRMYHEIRRALSTLDMTWEIVITDDGSSDGTWDCIKSLHIRDHRVRGIRFSRNFGHQHALFAGLSLALGDVVITMDADLQHPPAVIPAMIEHWSGGAKIVQMIRRNNNHVSWFKNVSSHVFYRMFSFMSGTELSPGLSDFRLLDRQVVNDLLQFRESGLFLRGLVEWMGYPVSRLEFECGCRFSGCSRYGLRKMLKLASDGLKGFSLVPLRLSIIIGLVTSFFSFYLLMEAVYTKLFTDQAVSGWASIVGSVSLLFGILFILIGVLGEYIGQILIQTRGRPRYIISERI